MRKGVAYPLFATLFLLLALLTAHGYVELTGGFSADRLLRTESAFLGYSAIQPAPDERLPLLKQPFRYLGSGHQSFAFVSADGRYVLKLLKNSYLKRDTYAKLIPPISFLYPLCRVFGEEHQRRQERLIKGYCTAWLRHPSGSGLVGFYTQASTTVELIDGLGRRIFLDLSHHPFAIQTKATTTRDELSRLLRNRQIDRVEERMKALCQLYQESFASGIYDEDHNILDNTGFVGEVAIRIDPGKVRPLKEDELNSAEEEIEGIFAKRLLPWINRQSS